MNVKQFTNKAAGRLIRSPKGYVAFGPNPLPPPLEPPSWELMGRLSEADRALSELAGIARTLPNPRLLNRDEYYRRLLAVSRTGAWTEWISYFLTGVATQARDAAKRSARMLDLWQEYRQRLQAARASGVLLHSNN